MHGILLFLSGSCLKTEVFKQLYCDFVGYLDQGASLRMNKKNQIFVDYAGKAIQ
jgi:hypothetical protein